MATTLIHSLRFAEAVDAGAGTGLPAPAPGGAVARRGTAAVATVAAADQAAADAAAARWEPVARQRAEFVMLADAMRRRHGCSDKAAWAMATARLTGFAALPATVAYNTYRNWRDDLAARDGRLDPANWRRLLPGYARTGRPAAATAEHPLIRLVSQYYLVEGGHDLPEALEMARMAARAHGLDHPELRLTLRQVRYFYERPEIREGVILARIGAERYRNERADWIDRDWAAVPPGHMLVGDHHVFDCAIRVWDAAAGRWVPKRPWLTAWMCNKSLYFPGWVIRDIAPDSLAIEDAFLMACIAMGNRPPPFVYVDNGKDFKSAGLFQDVAVLADDGREFRHSIGRRLGVEPIFAIAYNARAKVIEREFGEVARRFAKYWFGYLGNRPGNRPERGDYAWEHPELLPTLGELTEAFGWWLQHMYHTRPAAGSKITGGRAPADLWAEFDGGGRIALSDQELAEAMRKPIAAHGARKPLATVGRGGRIRHGSRWYRDQALWNWIDRRVLIKAPRVAGDEAIYVYRPDGTPICRATPVEAQPALARTDGERDRLSAGMAATRKQIVHARTIKAGLLPTGEEKRVAAGPVIDRLALAGHGLAEARRLVAALPPERPDEPEAVADAAPFVEADADLVRELDSLVHAREPIRETPAGNHDHDDVAMLAALVTADRRMN
jgi:hypothetical protein